MQIDCPKCGAADTWIEQSSPSYPDSPPILRCRCGLFQLTSQVGLENLIKSTESKRGLEVEEAEAREEAMFPYGRCAFRGCEEPARETSKYCSRLCNNRNARERAKQRKRAA